MEPIKPNVDLDWFRTRSAWADAGAFVTIADIQPLERGTVIANELGAELGVRCKYVWSDVTKWGSQVAAFQAALAASPFCVLDVVITFAGVCVQPGSLLDLVQAAGEPTRHTAPPQPDTANVDVNLEGAYYTAWLAMCYLRLEGEPNPSVPI
ncbi:hypothetical protein VTJ04DRAFT_10845 [Mycothermus thermophilus]|uniref:uncharacterized protein n=1 Tax=Humicola insolens TaxID=85995 RepID=UPI00374334D9